MVVSDEAWAWIEPLLPVSSGRRGGRWCGHRQVNEAIAWKYRTGSRGQEEPEQFGPWQTAYERTGTCTGGSGLVLRIASVGGG
ncbi:transposase [Geodermatophilus sp. CPCC 205761]|uniref:transposase n=1 Tax=Geodermatophilus sp. CPCC 205761 TaxID=2936597 RepID=UPI003F53AB71